MVGFIVDELVFAANEQVREQARLARPHVSRRTVQPARLRNRLARGLVHAGRALDASAVEGRTRGRGGCR